MTAKLTRAQTKEHNRRLVFKTIYHAGSISRAEIARQTGLTRPTVSSIVAELMERELVLATGRGESAGGKRPTLLALRADGNHILSLELSSQVFRGARLDLQGRIVHTTAVATAGRRGPAALALIGPLLAELSAAGDRPLLGLGVGTPGRVDGGRGLVRQALNLGWQDVALRDLLGEQVRRPVYVANNSHAAALGAYLYETGRATRNLILIKVGGGVGAGIVLDGRVLHGDGLAAGEIGHLVVDPAGPACTCGNRGCLETLAGARAILTHAGCADWPALLAAHGAGNRAAQAAVNGAATALGTAIAFLIAAFDVHHIFLSGPLADLGAPFLAAVRAAAARRALPAMVDAATIAYAGLDPDAILLGSAALVLQHELGLD